MMVSHPIAMTGKVATQIEPVFVRGGGAAGGNPRRIQP
jgi:hypothetical protein